MNGIHLLGLFDLSTYKIAILYCQLCQFMVWVFFLPLKEKNWGLFFAFFFPLSLFSDILYVSTKCELTNLEEEKASTNSDTIIDHVIVYWQISRVSPLGSLLKNALRKFATTFYSWVARDHHVCQSFSIWCCYTPSKEERTRNVIWKTTKLWSTTPMLLLQLPLHRFFAVRGLLLRPPHTKSGYTRTPS